MHFLVALSHFVMMINTMVLANSNKIRLCAEFEIDNFASNQTTPLTTIMALLTRQCMLKCVQIRPCMAFNYRSYDGQCVLLAKETCLIPNIAPGWKYISLATCQNRAPWRSIRPDNYGWNWTQLDDPQSRNDVIGVTANRPSRFVGRIFYKGLYLPGWGQKKKGESKVRAVDPTEETKASCLAGGEYIILGDDFMHQWIPLEVGGKVPENAVLAGYDPNFSPLFIVRALINGIPVSGYYHPGTKMAHFIFGRAQKSTNLKILTIKSKHVWCMCNEYILYIYICAYCIYSIDSKLHNIT